MNIISIDSVKKVTSRPSWDEYFMAMLPGIASRSVDPNTKTGCVIVGEDREVVSTGFNSFVRGADDMGHPERLERPEKYFHIEHAERNALYNSARIGARLKGCTLYVSWLPCMDCARGIVQCGITRVIVDKETHEKNRSPKWEEDFKRVEILFREVGIILTWWSRRK